MNWALLPERAVDLSLHAAILLGLVSTWAMYEWFGWVFAGFVVAGYIGALAWLAPGTLAVLMVESLLTYAVVWVVAVGIARTDAWSRVFGRERFLLFVLASLPVRLLVTGMAMPQLQGRLLAAGWSAEDMGIGLFGIGVVLVPLTANTFWKLGVSRGLLQLSVTGGATFAGVAMFSTFANLGFGDFVQTFDALAMHPFESSRMVLVLVCTVFVAAHNNLRYGWDFGGILVPALMSILIFTPQRLISTLAEVGVLFVAYRHVVGLPWVRELDLSGPRRIVSVYAVALFGKWAFAFALLGTGILTARARSVRLRLPPDCAGGHPLRQERQLPQDDDAHRLHLRAGPGPGRAPRLGTGIPGCAQCPSAAHARG